MEFREEVGGWSSSLVDDRVRLVQADFRLGLFLSDPVWRKYSNVLTTSQLLYWSKIWRYVTSGAPALVRAMYLLVFLAVPAAAARLTSVAQAQAPTPSAVPGAGYGFLIDKHVAARVACNACHTAGPATPPEMPTCLGCHGGSYAKLAVMTANARPNPHQSHQGEISCGACHHIHSASVTLCNQCHSYDMTTP